MPRAASTSASEILTAFLEEDRPRAKFIARLSGVVAAVGNFPIPTALQAADNNFWGSAAGPNASGSGDAVGGACDVNGGKTTVKTFATQSFGITTF